MADLVVWSGNPFSVYTRADQVYIDGARVYDRFSAYNTEFLVMVVGDEVSEDRHVGATAVIGIADEATFGHEVVVGFGVVLDDPDDGVGRGLESGVLDHRRDVPAVAAEPVALG